MALCDMQIRKLVDKLFDYLKLAKSCCFLQNLSYVLHENWNNRKVTL